MKYKNQEEIDVLAKELIRLRTKANKSKNKNIKQKFENYQSICFEKFKSLVIGRVGKYRKFSNYGDLIQDGYEALVLALRTYNPDKGSFTWWADKYISTRISRAANAHSTIRFPLKKARELKPFKISTIPVLIDMQPDAFSNMENLEISQYVLTAIKELPEQHQQLISLIYGFQGMKPQPMGTVIKSLKLSRPQCLMILEEAKSKLKEKLIGIE